MAKFSAFVEHEAAETRKLRTADMESAPHGYANSDNPDSSREHERLRKVVEQLNTIQRRAYEYAATYLDAGPSQQMLCVVTGKAGTGKSRVLRAIHQLWRYQHGGASVALVAQTNAASHLIGGETFYHLFGLQALDSDAAGPSLEHRAALRERLCQRLARVQLMCLDEKSLVNCNTFHRLSEWLCWIRGNSAPFGGLHVILFGDFYQLPPVNGAPLYTDCAGCTKAAWNHCARCAQRAAGFRPADTAGRKLFRDRFLHVFVLRQNMRSGQDAALDTATSYAAVGRAPPPEVLATLNSRVMTAERAAAQTPPHAMWTASTRAKVHALNTAALKRLTDAGRTCVNIHAQHFRNLQAAKQGQQLDSKLRHHLLQLHVAPELVSGNLTESYAPPPRATLRIAVGSRVALDFLLAPPLGLVKHATGTVLGFLYDKEQPIQPGLSAVDAARARPQPQLPIVVVQMDERWYTGASVADALHGRVPGVTRGMRRAIPVAPRTAFIQYNGLRYMRKQIPLRPATATTVHVAQGSTVPDDGAHVMTPPTPPPGHAPGLTLVQISRCQRLSQLFLTFPLMPAHFTGFPRRHEEINAEMARLRALAKRTRAAAAGEQDEEDDADGDGTTTTTQLSPPPPPQSQQPLAPRATNKLLLQQAFTAVAQQVPDTLNAKTQCPVAEVRAAMQQWLTDRKRHALSDGLNGRAGRESVKTRIRAARLRQR